MLRKIFLFFISFTNDEGTLIVPRTN